MEQLRELPAKLLIELAERLGYSLVGCKTKGEILTRILRSAVEIRDL